MKKTYTTHQKKLNMKNCYLVFITLVALVSLFGNIIQDRFYNKALDIQQVTIDRYASNEYAVMNYEGK